MFNPNKPPNKIAEEEDDLMADLVAFANAQGGLIIIGVDEDAQGRASRLSPMSGDQAKRLADRLWNLAISHVRPGIVQLEVADFRMKEDGSEWIVLVRAPDGQDKPYMSAFGHQTRFTLRVDNRNREMSYDEIQKSFLDRPQEQRSVRVLLEIESINARLDGLERKLKKVE